MYELNEKAVELELVRKHMTILFEQMCVSGVQLFVDGEAVLPMEAAARSVREDSPYMADYVFGDAGKIEQIRFDRVTQR